jgi:hypothetical protein
VVAAAAAWIALVSTKIIVVVDRDTSNQQSV